MRRVEETLHMHVTFAALEDSQCQKRLWGLANSCTSPFYEMRVCSKAHQSTQITVSDRTSQARYLLSRPGSHSRPMGVSRSKEGPGSPCPRAQATQYPGRYGSIPQHWEETDHSRRNGSAWR